jgi:hypothetical protein
MNEFEFSDWLSPEERLDAEIQFLELEKRQQEDPWHLWRIEVNLALANEGINIMWPEDEDIYAVAVVQPIITDEWIKDFEKIPVLHLRELFDHETPAHPRAVAAYLKTVLYDKRFRLWEYEED